MQIPGAVIFVNNDLTDQVEGVLIIQLYIDETITDTEFDNRIIDDPNYANVVRNSHRRLLVIRKTFHDYTNRDLADIVIFIKSGLAYVEKNNFGPPSLTLPVVILHMETLLKFNGKI
jgi:hypothetical protein